MFKEYEESDKDQLQEVHLYKQVDRKFQTLYIQSLVRGALHSMWKEEIQYILSGRTWKFNEIAGNFVFVENDERVRRAYLLQVKHGWLASHLQDIREW